MVDMIQPGWYISGIQGGVNMRRICLAVLLICLICATCINGISSEYDQGFGFTYFQVTGSVSMETYRAGRPVTFTVDILEGNPPYTYSWELGETFNTRSYSLLEDYINDDNFIMSLPHGKTNSNKISFTYTPPVLGDDLTAICYITDRDGKVAEEHMTVYSPLAWASKYAQYVLDSGFLRDDSNISDFYDNPIYEIDDLYSGPFIEFRRPICFSLYDMNGDGIPELLMDLGGDYAMGDIRVFTYQDHQMQFAGEMPYREFFMPTVSATRGMPGIYYSTGIAGSFDTSFYYLSGNQLEGEELFNESYYIYDDDGNPIQELDEPVITWGTENKRLVADWKIKNRKMLLMYPLEIIRKLGWWNDGFLELPFTGASKDQTVINTITRVQQLAEEVKDRDAILGYGYYKGLPDSWLNTQMWIDFFQGHVSSLNVSYNRQRFLFQEAIRMCTTQGKKSKFVDMNEMPEGLVVMNKELKFEQAAYAGYVKKLIDPKVLKENKVKADYFDKLLSDTASGKRSYLDTQQDLAALGMSDDAIEDVLGSINMVDTIRITGKLANTYDNVKKAWNSVAEIANKWSLLDSLDREQMFQIAMSYRLGNEDMKAVSDVLETIAKADKAGQITLVTSDKVMKLGLDYLFEFLSKTMMREMTKVSGSMVTAGYALTYAAIDYLTGVGDLTESNANLVFAGEVVDHFWNDINNCRGYLHNTVSESLMLRTAYAYVNYYTAAAELNEKYYELVQTGDKAILKDLINNDAMRQESLRAKEQAKELRRLAQEMVQILRDSGLY